MAEAIILRKFDLLTVKVSYYEWWRFDADEHGISRRKMLGFIVLSCLTGNAKIITIRYLVVEGLSL